MKTNLVLGLGVIGLIGLSGCSTTPETGEASSMKESHRYISSIDKATPIHIELFSTEGAELDITPDEDTSLAVAKAAPQLLAADIVHTLRASGFEMVTLQSAGVTQPSGALVLSGRFTMLDSGSQAARIWLGFGMGQSQVCVEGRLVNATGKTVCDFKDCAGGIGWGESAPQLENESHTLGEKIGHFIAGMSR